MSVVADEIEGVVETIDTYGHYKGEYGNVYIGFCLLGAMGWRGVGVGTHLAVRDALGRRYGHGNISEVNDHPNTKWGDLRDKLLGYAKDLRNQQ